MDSAPRRFEGLTAVVTGGASGIGRGTAERLASEGAKVWVADLDGDRAAETAQQLAGARPVRIDVTEPESVAAAMAHVVERDGRIDVLVNNAGVVTPGASTWATEWADWQRIIAVNLSGIFLGCRYALPYMIEARSGAVVSTSSDAAKVGWPGQSAYCASKAGVVGLSRSAAMDAAPYGVRVNCVLPAFTDTPMLRRWVDAQPDPEGAMQEVANTQPMGRIGDVKEIAAAIAFLASSEASMITGVGLSVDGGVTAATAPSRGPEGDRAYQGPPRERREAE